ncbi:MAG: hypothetical protein IPM97_10150 [Bdellovibrionaceae bacterium]|nr:hypothetical protein [Pseudobdellovibrionaceae bacterium]
MSVQALVTTDTLPGGINSPGFRYGIIGNAHERYLGDGTLMSLGDAKSLVLDTDSVKRMNPDTQKLIDVLNSFGDGALGDKLNFGVLRVRTMPEVKYFAPIFSRGITDKWTVAFGFPVITYKNTISITQEYSNIAYYREQFKGLSPRMDAAFNINLAKATNEALQAKGYRALNHRDETFLGDVQFVSVYKFYETRKSAMIYMAMLGLPTGPAYDPSDLMAINIFGRTTLSNMVAYSHRIGSRFSLMPYATYLLNVEDKVTARVPLNEEDSLPDINSEQTVSRSIGNTAVIGSNVFYELSDSWTFGAAYEALQKKENHYRGERDSRYDLLSKNTQSAAQRVKGEVTYSTVKSYLDKSAKVPLMFSFEVSDVIAGINFSRQFLQEMNLVLFF